jgi:hypothetical protein
MDFSTMARRVEAQAYGGLDHFQADFDLMVANCLQYNPRDSYFHRAAVRMRDQGGVLIRKARRDAERIGFDPLAGIHLPEAPKLEPAPPFSWDEGKATSRSGRFESPFPGFGDSHQFKSIIFYLCVP